MNEERRLLVVSGPSGSGKDTVVRRLMERYPGIELSVSATTRARRAGEREGVDYYFVTQQEFRRMIEQRRVLEYTCYCGNYYGTPRAQVEARLARGITVVLVIEVEGGANIKRLYPECTTVFITPPSFAELERRLRLRATEDEASIRRRLQRAQEEMGCADQYDYRLVNDDLELCVERLHDILCARQQGEVAAPGE